MYYTWSDWVWEIAAVQPAWTPLYFMMYHNYPLVMHNKATKHFIAMGETNLANDVVVVVVNFVTFHSSIL